MFLYDWRLKSHPFVTTNCQFLFFFLPPSVVSVSLYGDSGVIFPLASGRMGVLSQDTVGRVHALLLLLHPFADENV